MIVSMAASKRLIRCAWCEGNELYINYHDEEWGVPLHDDQKLFELLSLEGAQAGLSWLTVLKKRQAYREAFANFDIATVAKFEDKKVAELLGNSGIIRNKLKIQSIVQNAQAVLGIHRKYGSLDAYIWSFTNNKVIQHKFKVLEELPPSDEVSTAMSRDFQADGLNFVGPTICYAFMQSIGMVNDHLLSCYRYSELS
jgi:DNA-3-methyladenine glycosylase I